MTQLGEAIARYHKIIESAPYRDLAWAESLREEMQTRLGSAVGTPVSPVLRPHFLSKRQYSSLVKAAESLFSAIDRIKQIALASPALLSRMELLPAEKMLAAVDPGYPFLSVASLLDTHLSNGSLRFVEYNADAPSGVAYGEMLAELFYDAAPVKELRKRYPLTRVGGIRYLLDALLKAYAEFGGASHPPHIGILEFRQQFPTSQPGELVILREFFQRAGYPTEVVSPDQLEYKNGQVRAADFPIDILYRRVKAHEFLVRFDLMHPLVRAYRERAVCLVNSFRSELAHKKALFDLLTDPAITASFPAAERKAIREFIPWTRMVTLSKTTYQDQTIDLPEFIYHNRQKLVLKPNDDSGDEHAFLGWEMDDAGWDRALKTALRHPYVVQERVAPVSEQFPIYQWGSLEFRELHVDVHPHAFLGKVEGCSSWVNSPDAGFSTINGLAPTFILG
jgi:hypothetical protein